MASGLSPNIFKNTNHVRDIWPIRNYFFKLMLNRSASFSEFHLKWNYKPVASECRYRLLNDHGSYGCNIQYSNYSPKKKQAKSRGQRKPDTSRSDFSENIPANYCLTRRCWQNLRTIAHRKKGEFNLNKTITVFSIWKSLENYLSCLRHILLVTAEGSLPRFLNSCSKCRPPP